MSASATSTTAAIPARIAYSQDEFAAMIGSTPEAIRQKVRRGRVPTVRIGGRRMVPAAYVDAVRAGDEEGIESSAL